MKGHGGNWAGFEWENPSFDIPQIGEQKSDQLLEAGKELVKK